VESACAKETEQSSKALQSIRSNWKQLLAPDQQVPLPTEDLALSKAQWRERLTEAEFSVLRDGNTEKRSSSPLNAEHRAGVYTCTACGLPLFTSAMKYESGTGWPSFFTTIPEVFETELDFGSIWPRTEYHCRRCNSHHGHVFDDGPEPTGKRWCNNGIALNFIPTKTANQNG
jgi:peptide-methionine (R)-S-oxide reductase